MYTVQLNKLLKELRKKIIKLMFGFKRLRIEKGRIFTISNIMIRATTIIIIIDAKKIGNVGWFKSSRIHKEVLLP